MKTSVGFSDVVARNRIDLVAVRDFKRVDVRFLVSLALTNAFLEILESIVAVGDLHGYLIKNDEDPIFFKEIFHLVGSAVVEMIAANLETKFCRGN